MTDVKEMLRALESYKNEAQHMIMEIEDDCYMHSTEWYYYKGMVKAFELAMSTIVKIDKEN